jgi:rhamnose utilization protein RhaD (predicted bifunctional aldolase and dehydrogenase)
MKSGWVDSEAQAAIDRYAAQGIGRDLAARVYTTRLLGRDPKLVLHGGGNTSVKTIVPDLLGEEVAVLCIKGSGADMAVIEPAGLPAVRLERLRKLRARTELTDEDMVRVQRENLLDPAAPNPSVETLLHAFLPHKFVDHTHANAILSLVDQPDGEAICADLYDGRMSVVPYVMPGFALAKMAADVYDAKPDVEGLILHKHGIFTFGESARDAYERMIALVTLAEGRLQRNRGATAAGDRAAHRGGPHPARRVQPQGCKDRGRMATPDPRLPHRPRHHEFCRRRGHCPLQPGGGGDARSYHPHQELAAGGRRAGEWQDG